MLVVYPVIPVSLEGSARAGMKGMNWRQRKPKVNSSHSTLGLGVPVTTRVSSLRQT